MPIAINSNRPPSTSSVPSSGAPRTTTTSRRGGRTRSRSPATMGSRIASPPEMMQPGTGENPSSAAAAAAAAAKAFAGSSGTRGAWPPESEDFSRGRSYDKHRNWPGEEGRSYPAHMRRYPGASNYPEGRGRSGPFRTHPGEEPPYDRRYRQHRYDNPERGRYPRQYPPDYRYERGEGRHHVPPPHHHKGPSGPGGTSIVLGGRTPIHVPKRSGSGYERRERGGSAASVFRGRPERTGSASPSSGTKEKKEDDDNAQRILLSLRTPTSSFEERDKAKKISLSPDEPSNLRGNINDDRADPLLESQRSLDAKPSASIDMAPSFTLFNQSFDSFGDGNYFNVDSTLQNDSFGMTQTKSIEEDAAQLLHKKSSVGDVSQQLLTASSGPLNINYSPVNSFGGGSTQQQPPSRRGGNMMILGDARSSSPTQVLGMYRSYSGAGSNARQDPLDDAHMRMSVGGSFGQGPSLSYASNSGRAFVDAPPPAYFSSEPMRSNDSGDSVPRFYAMLRRFKSAFEDCTFLLPGLQAALQESSTSAADGNEDTDKPVLRRLEEPAPQDLAVARRRVESSICAFGGNVNRNRSKKTTKEGKDSIFRGKDESGVPKSVTVTPSSSSSQADESKNRAMAIRRKYEETLTSRYYENESRLSWEFEESPPIEVIEDPVSKETPKNTSADAKNEQHDSKDDTEKADEGMEGAEFCQPVGDDDSSDKKPDAKMRYKCKLCGQPKQNHRCPFQQSLARSIGIMIYPSVNAFTAAEPGTLAAPLSEMNNFVDLKEGGSVTDESHGRPTPDRLHRLGTGGAMSSTTQVTPESMRSSTVHSPGSFATPSRSGGRHRRPGRSSKKRTYAQVNGSEDQSDLLFIDSMELKPEQFRVVSDKTRVSAYTYPALPLPYAQRKRLSDNLFSLSNEIPKLTDECAQVLREAREKDSWDQAVAELMTQVIVIIHCPNGDNRFEGLRQYLLTLGIAC